MKAGLALAILLASCQHVPLTSTVSSSVKSGCKHTKTSLKCVKHVRTIDGDTAVFNVDNVHQLLGVNLRVRVFGIDAGEKNSRSGCEKRMFEEAGKFLRERLSRAARIDITRIKGWDGFGRVLGEIVFDGQSVSKLMLENKLAYPYQKVGDWCEMERQFKAR